MFALLSSTIWVPMGIQEAQLVKEVLSIVNQSFYSTSSQVWYWWVSISPINLSSHSSHFLLGLSLGNSLATPRY